MDEANEIGVEIENNKDAHIAILRDTLDDLRGQNRFVKKVCVMLFCLVVALVGAVIGLHIYDQQKLMNFLSDYEVSYENTVTTDNNSPNNGTITIGR